MDFILKYWVIIAFAICFIYLIFRVFNYYSSSRKKHGRGQDIDQIDVNKDQSLHFVQNQSCNNIDITIDPQCGAQVDTRYAVKQVVNGRMCYFCNENCRITYIKKHHNSDI